MGHGRKAELTAAAPVVDAACFVLFAALGRRSHGEGDAIRGVVAVALPFAAAWLGVALAAGVYRRASLRRVALAWLVAWPLGLLLRHLAGRGVPLSFDLVVLLVNGALLVGWRGLSRLAQR